MMTPRGPARFLAALGALALLSGCVAGGSQPSEVRERPLAVVYRGPAACEGCPEAVASLLEEGGGFTVEFIGPEEARNVTGKALEDVSLYAQPGGGNDVGLAMEQLGAEATAALIDWVHAGGSYLGFCMGAYMAGTGPGMGLLTPGDTMAYDETEGALVEGPEPSVIPVMWGGELRYQYAQDAAVILESGVEGERVLSRYTNGHANALVRPVGDGAVGVVGTHPEAEDDWFSAELKEADIDGSDRAQARELVDALRDVG